MTDREIVIALAGLMGWQVVERSDNITATKLFADPSSVFICFQFGDNRPFVYRYSLDSERFEDECWNPIERIADAWMVVEKMREQGCCFSCGEGDEAWFAQLTGPGDIEGTGQALTMPRAICLAALKAVQNA